MRNYDDVKSVSLTAQTFAAIMHALQVGLLLIEKRNSWKKVQLLIIVFAAHTRMDRIVAVLSSVRGDTTP